MRYIKRSKKKAKQVRLKLVMTFYKLLFFKYNRSSNQLLFKDVAILDMAIRYSIFTL